jgi:radical SAM superfamily enzyme YgiQ (UPF0313 family)
MFNNFIKYSEPVFRPPSEANSFILQVTHGCSWNKCAFCEMYTSKRFTVRNEKDVFDDIKLYAEFDPNVNKVFLGDGNASVLSTKRLLSILVELNKTFPKLRRISAYSLPSELSKKTESELKELFEAGLKLVYIGIESGDDELLKLINKCETYSSTAEGILKAQNAGIQTSVMLINGLGGQKYSRQHAINSARLVNEIQPHYLSTLVLSFPYGVEHFRERFSGEYLPMSIPELLEELKILIENTDLKSTIFRSDHASNYIILKGILSSDKEKLVNELSYAINNPDKVIFKPEWMRGL